MNADHDNALAVECSICHQAPGQSCRNYRGRPCSPHGARLAAGREAEGIRRADAVDLDELVADEVERLRKLPRGARSGYEPPFDQRSLFGDLDGGVEDDA